MEGYVESNFFFFFRWEDKKHILEIYEFECGKTSIT